MSLWDLAKIVHDGPHDGRKLCTMPLVHKVMSTRLWTPGMPVMEETPTEPFLGAVGFGQRDDDSWAAIVSCLQQRKVATFKDYLVYSRAELVSMLKALDLKKTPLSYLNAIEEASGLKAEVAVPRRVGVRCSRWAAPPARPRDTNATSGDRMIRQRSDIPFPRAYHHPPTLEDTKDIASAEITRDLFTVARPAPAAHALPNSHAPCAGRYQADAAEDGHPHRPARRRRPAPYQ